MPAGSPSPDPRRRREDRSAAGKDGGKGRPSRDGGRTDSAGGQHGGKGRPRRDPGPSDSRRASRRNQDGGNGGPRAGGAASSAGPTRSRSTAGRWRRDELPTSTRTAVQAEYDGPPLPDDITGTELDRSVTNQLKSLPEKLAARVARHLVAAARLVDTDPETAYRHTLAARARAARVSAVREACGEAAYAAGRFKEALTEFQAGRRMSGSPIYLALMADCERALGRPERALTLAKDPAVERLDEADQIEVKIVESGARRDLGDFSAAVRTLEGRELRTRSRAPWVARLRYAYAEALLAAGDTEGAREWFERAAGVDALGQTDAADRLAELEGIVVVDTLAEAADEAVSPLDAGQAAETSITPPTDSQRRSGGTTNS